MWTTRLITGAAIAVSALVFAGCSRGGSKDVPTPRSTSPSAETIRPRTDLSRIRDSASQSAPMSSRRAASACVAKQVSVSLGPVVSPETGEHGAIYEIHNASPHSCVLSGYPVVSLMRGAHLLPFEYVHNGQYVTKAPPPVVTLAGGMNAYFLVAKYRCDARTNGLATVARLRLPGQAVAFQVSTGPHSLIGFCEGNGEPDPGDRVQISPIEAEVADLGGA